MSAKDNNQCELEVVHHGGLRIYASTTGSRRGNNNKIILCINNARYGQRGNIFTVVITQPAMCTGKRGDLWVDSTFDLDAKTTATI